MLFNSTQFLIFFPIVTFLYFILPTKKRWIMLLAAGAIFYMAFIPGYIFILIILILIDYFAGRIIELSSGRPRKLLLILSLAANIGFLGFFKYFNFFSINLELLFQSLGLHFSSPQLSFLLPLGLSFHTFQSMSYTIEVYKGHQKAEHHLGIYALYVMFYPQLVAGPIERPQNLLRQLKEDHQFDPSRVSSGLKLMLWGFFKKVVIADRLAVFVNLVYSNPSQYSGISLLIATYFFAFQIFCDFSGYTDIAIGAAQVMGINLMTNFNRPYFSRSIAEFWNRWHISLSSWFRDYIYIPLGGNRVNKWRWYRNIMIVFLISGLWHGADWKFILWGGIHGGLIILTTISKEIRERFISFFHINPFINQFLSILITFNFVSFAWIFFRANSIKDAFLIISRIINGLTNLNSLTSNIFIGTNEIALIISLIAFMGVVHYSQREEKSRQMFSQYPVLYRWLIYYFLVLSIIFLGQFDKLKFIYFQF